MARLTPYLICSLLVVFLAACGGDSDKSEPTAVAVFSNAVPLPDYEGEEGFVLQIVSGSEPTMMSSDSDATVQANFDDPNEKTGTPITRLVFSQGDETALTLHLPQGLEAIPYPIRSWESLESSATTVFATVQFGGKEYAENLIGTLRVSEVSDGTISATLYFDGGPEGGTRITVAGDFRGLDYPGKE